MATLKRKYSDFSMVFEPHPVTKDILKLTDNDCVKRSIRNLILTGFYEIPFRPNFGSGIKQRLFENVSVATKHQMIADIESAINIYERRAKILKIDLQLNEDMNGFDVSIEFEVVGIEIPIKIDMFLERVR